MELIDKVLALQEFLNEIPTFLSDLEPGNEFVAIEGVPQDLMIWKVIKDFSVEVDLSDGTTTVSGKLGITEDDLKLLPDALKESAETPFDFKEFISFFEDYWLDFLNEKGISEEEIEVEHNMIKFRYVSIEKEPELEVVE